MAKPKKDDTDVRDNLAGELAEALNKETKGATAAFFLDDCDDPSQVVDWISTGNSILDLAVSNRPNGGLPVGRIVEFNGLEGSGKSLVCAHALADIQRKGGVAVFIDSEASVSNEFLRAIGVDIGKMLYIPSETCEDALEKIESIVEKVRKSDKKKLVGIVWDSVAGSSTEKELGADHGQDGWATGKAIILSKGMRKINNMIARERILLICTNQVRVKMDAGPFGDKWTTSGGKALPFHASVRVRLKSMGQLKIGDEVAGTKTKAIVIKNRLGPPHRSAEFNIYYDRGIDNYGSWLEFFLEKGIITNAKAEKPVEEGAKKKSKKEIEAEKEEGKKSKSLQFTITVEGKDPEVVKFEKKQFVSLMKSNQEYRDYLYSKMCEEMIMKYRGQDDDFADDVEVADEAPGAED